jgi:CRISPR-associated endonuclease Csn1
VRDDDRHHALDAAVIAACSHAYVNHLSDYSRREELKYVRNAVDMETGEIRDMEMFSQLERHFPRPWENFRNELLLRLDTDDLDDLKRMGQQYGYPPEVMKNLHPLFVSRAPKRRNGGAVHEATIYSRPVPRDGGGVTKKVFLTDLKLSDIADLVDPHRNKKLYDAIRERLEAHGGNGKKAFPPDTPLRKPDRDGNPTGPIVRSVKKNFGKKSGIQVHGGIATGLTWLRVDVFRHKKDKKYHLVPVYVHHATAEELPNRAIVAHRDESEWTLIDEQNFDFCFSLYSNDLIRVKLREKTHFGYYDGCDRTTGSISLWVHDRNKAVGKDGLIRSIGVKTALSVEKFNVDVLGNIYPALPEERRGLA